MSLGLVDVFVYDKTATIRKRAVVVGCFLLPYVIGTGDDDSNRVAFCDLLRVIAKDYPTLVDCLGRVLGSIPEQSIYPDYEAVMSIWRRLGKDSTAPNDYYARARVLVDGLRRVYDLGNSDRLLAFFKPYYSSITLADLDLLLTDLFRVFYTQYAFLI